MNKHQVKAFTIMEVTITMLIAAILIGITYTTYTIISKSYLSFQVKNNGMADLETLDKLLRRDFDRADLIAKDTGGIAITNASQVITYQFKTDYIVRISGRIDTFRIKAGEFTTLFEGQAITELNPSPEENRIDQIDLVLLFRNEKIPYHYHKQYSSANLIQRNPNAIH